MSKFICLKSVIVQIYRGRQSLRKFRQYLLSNIYMFFVWVIH